MFKSLLTIILIIPLILSAQIITIEGIVVDQNNNEPLAFVNIVSQSGYGAISDIDGKFKITTDISDCCLKLTYIGYEPQNYQINNNAKTQYIRLKPKIFNLDEVIILPGLNPAHRIIKNVINNREINDPQKIEAFTYTSYDKMILTIEADSIMNSETSTLDTNQLRVRKLLDKQYLFLLETVTERKYMAPGLNQENVIATRVSGFNDPLMAFMISQIQSTSFYDEHIQIAGNDYINPISKGSTKKYFFLIEDTIFNNSQDSIFIISFRPKANKKFVGMKGFLHINSNSWAIQNVKAEPNDDTTGIRINIQQSYEFIQDHWFPVQLNTDIVFNVVNASDGTNDYPLIGHGRSYIKDIDLNPQLKKRDFSYHEVEIDEEATKRKGEFWKSYRVDSLTQKEIETYRVIDSIGKAENFDKIANSFQTIINGQIPFKFINIDLDKFIHYNEYEGLYLGVGLHTNHKISKNFNVGAYWGYGFRDEASKYGGDLSINIHKRSESVIRIDAYNKVVASGSVEFFDDKYQVWQPDNFYEFFFKQMNTTKGGDINYTFRIRALRDFKWNFGGLLQEKLAYKNYFFTSTSNPFDTITEFNNTAFSAGFRFAFREKILQTTKGQHSMGSRYPIVWLNYTQGIKDLFNSNFSYQRIDIKINFIYDFKYLGQSSIKAMSGIIIGELPISNLFSGIGSYSPLTLFAPGSFGTMRPNEFYSDRYISLFMSHNFKSLLFAFGNYKPELMLVTNIAFGSLSNPSNHNQINFNTLENGYYESGLVIRKLLDLKLYDLGVGVLYRYGPYGFNTPSKNFAYKISLFYAF